MALFLVAMLIILCFFLGRRKRPVITPRQRLVTVDEQQSTTTTPRPTTIRTTTTRKPTTTTTYKSYVEPKTSPNAYTNDYVNNHVINNAYDTGNNDEMPFTNFGDSYNYYQDMNNQNHHQNSNQYDYQEANHQENLPNNFQQNLQNNYQENPSNSYEEKPSRNLVSAEYDANERSDDDYYDEYDYDYDYETENSESADKSDSDELSWIQESAKNLENLMSMIKNLNFNQDSNGNLVVDHTTEKDESRNNAANVGKDEKANLKSQNNEHGYIQGIYLFGKLIYKYLCWLKIFFLHNILYVVYITISISTYMYY